MSTILIRNISLLVTMDKDRHEISDGAIFIEDGWIKEVGKTTDLPSVAEKVVDLSGHIVLPGFINTHTHAAMVYFRGVADDMPLHQWLHQFIWPLEKQYLRPQFVKHAMELAVAEMLLSGITAFNDMYFFEDEAAQVCSKVGIRAFLGEGILDFPSADSKDADEALSYILRLNQKYKDDDLITIYPAPHAIYSCSKENLTKSKAVAEELNSPLHIHLSATSLRGILVDLSSQIIKIFWAIFALFHPYVVHSFSIHGT